MDNKSREKITVTAGVILAIVISYLAFFVFPTIDSIKKQEKQLQANKKNMNQLKSLLEKHQKIEKKPSKKLEGSLSAFVEKTAGEIGITIAYIRPYGEGGKGVEIKVDEMEGQKIIQFVYEMEKNGVNISRLNMRDYKGTGIWVVKFNLET